MATPNPLESLFMNSDRADVIFVVDGEEIPGHRLILSAVSPHFEKFLYGHFKESNSKHVEIQETSPKVFKELIRFIYKGQLEISGWTIEELLALLALAHRYEFQLLFEKVVELLQDRPLDVDSWTLVNDVATLYDSIALKEKCNSFAESKMDDFLVQKDLDRFSGQLICSMFESPKVATVKQDQLLGALLKWKIDHSSDGIMSVFQKICWEKVSHDITSNIVKVLFSNLKNANDYQFWTKIASLYEECKGEQPSDSVIKVDCVSFQRGQKLTLALPTNNGDLYFYAHNLGFYTSGYVNIEFKKNNSGGYFPVRKIEFESETKLMIETIHGYSLQGGWTDMIVSEPTSNNGCFKYSAAFSETKQVSCLYIHSPHFNNMSQITLRNIVIYS